MNKNRFRLSLMLCLCTVILLPCVHAEEDAETHFILGEGYADHEMFPEAMQAYDLALKKDPNMVEAYMRRAVLSIRTDRDDAALEDLNRAIELKPHHAEAYFYRGLALDRLGKSEDALKDYNRALELGFKDARLHYYRARLNELNKDYALALQDCDQAIAMRTRYEEALFLRAKVHTHLEHWDEALEDYAAVEGINPKNEGVLWGKFDIYAQTDRLNKAKKLLEDIAKKLPETVETYLLLADKYESLALLEETEAMLTTAIRVVDEKESSQLTALYRERARLFEKQEKWDEAIDDYTRWISTQPKEYEPYAHRALLRFEQGDVFGSIEDNSLAIYWKPSFAQAYLNRAIARQKEELFDAMTEDLEQAFHLGDSKLKAELLPVLQELNPQFSPTI